MHLLQQAPLKPISKLLRRYAGEASTPNVTSAVWCHVAMIACYSVSVEDLAYKDQGRRRRRCECLCPKELPQVSTFISNSLAELGISKRPPLMPKAFPPRSLCFRVSDSVAPTQRGFATTAAAPEKPDIAGEKKILVTFVNKDGEEKEVEVALGKSMLIAAHENDIELEGACEGSMACSTCHVIIMDQDRYDKLPEPSDDENDILDLALGLTETSRLGCQLIAKEELNGLRMALPHGTHNLILEGYDPK